ncbi:MAG: hypothetical protein A3C90_02260 [Candidatus Magasanikbacteria bacterium RIFCSPHIGHO2_02_FULL_51_14]|uniref:Adenine DNA glycosylase n=1 Tax=Candidatus Magasanikbacteria bacterium RIFCSPHIGHO2_02_FULL_51_14 TaxID=1798683 RepID=A0A1F6MRB3_9BACT|nr:MAG: hypothetical protein A3C90_02260 [Candidatus Magasanikbacteria bacterium RIFCSPHIGHO2_02_FULL_51_14]
MLSTNYKALIRDILKWYTTNRRDLPWRHTRDPYKILVSEIMLQQTQVDRVVPKYHAFLKRFPKVEKLARAKTSSVIKEWAGLGYNRRALYLQRAAQKVMLDYGGEFPRLKHELKKLPGVGEYTARAILCFAFGEPVAMLDTNHRKVYRHVFFRGKEMSDVELLKRADRLVAQLPQTTVYDWNQALMDYGATLKIQETRYKKQKRIPFKQTDRYYRGRIVDLLRENDAVPRRHIEQRFDDIPRVRLHRIIGQLKKDQLIVSSGATLCLP